MNKPRLLSRAAGLGLALAIWTAMPLHAWAGGNRDSHGHIAAAADMTDGEVRKVDADEGKLTLKHADIKSLDMPAMTMVFVVKDKAMLSGVKAGDKVKLKAVNEAGKFTITEMHVVR